LYQLASHSFIYPYRNSMYTIDFKYLGCRDADSREFEPYRFNY
jgi:hypothetical protein